MKEAMYAWRLKRHIMYIYNAMNRLQEAAVQGNAEAIKILRFYQLGTEQMYRLDNNSHELIELRSQLIVKHFVVMFNVLSIEVKHSTS
jgi:hypothetical protein